MDIFCRQAIEAHNKFRAAHNVPSLVWATDLARDAEAWAKTLADEGKLTHDQLKEVGENVFMASQGFDTVGQEAVKSWYSEVEKYNFKAGRYQPGTGHFTQVVWKSTKELGVARAQSSDGSVFVVARYRPGGNDLNSFKENVLPKVLIGEETPAETTETLDVMTEKYKPHLEDAAFIDAVLTLHNGYRFLHNVQPIEWSHALALQAQSWAEKLAREGNLHHASKEERMFKGENICRMSRHYDIGDALRMWYSEIQKYDYNSPTFSLDTGHFTQIVWSNTSEIGVGVSQSPDGRLTYLVARYNPPGNILNKFAENVSPKVR